MSNEQPDAHESQLLPLITSGEWGSLLAMGLAALRRQRKLTQRELASAAGLNIDTIGRLERGAHLTRAPHEQTLQLLASAFGCASLTAFWQALQQAGSEGHSAGRDRLLLDERSTNMLRLFSQLTSPQKDLVEALALQLRGKLHAQRLGQEAICQVDPEPSLRRRHG
ncbi:MAG: helix-turn-helix domain-containing protein [Chloroflexota bacterium]|nr:helix-turn-helix domain-containing protein [Chloroflexota bacterium]